MATNWPKCAHQAKRKGVGLWIPGPHTPLIGGPRDLLLCSTDAKSNAESEFDVGAGSVSESLGERVTREQEGPAAEWSTLCSSSSLLPMLRKWKRESQNKETHQNQDHDEIRKRNRYTIHLRVLKELKNKRITRSLRDRPTVVAMLKVLWHSSLVSALQ